jgi:septal ring factor EnvC (AmiA/AmiB activator)
LHQDCILLAIYKLYLYLRYCLSYKSMKSIIATYLLLFSVGLFVGYMLFNCDDTIVNEKYLEELKQNIKEKDLKIDSLKNAILITKNAISVIEDEEREAEEKLKNFKQTKDEKKKMLDGINDTVYNKQLLDSLANNVQFR